MSSRSLKLSGPFRALLCAATCALAVAGCDKQSNAPTQPNLDAHASGAPAPQPTGGTFDTAHKGDPLPAVTISDPSGKKLDIASLKGKPVLINLWATWCGPCVAELPTLASLARSKGNALRVVTVSEDMKTDKVPAFLKEKAGKDLPVWLDPNTALSSKYLLETLPTSIFYDADGKEVWRLVGAENWEGVDATTRLAQGGVR
jgi:thiol-disulfide isomerase/thioredoxin